MDMSRATDSNLDHTEWLPNELLHVLLNETDSSGRFFLHPTGRVLLRLVSKRWHDIVKSASESYGTRSRLVAEPCARLASPANVEALCAGRLATTSGMVRFVRDSVSAVDRGDENAVKCRVSERVSAYMAAVGCTVAKDNRRKNLNALAAMLPKDGTSSSCHDGHTSWSRAQRRAAPIVPRTLALLGEVQEAIAFFDRHQDIYTDIVIFAQRYFDMLCAVAGACYDDPAIFLSAMATAMRYGHSRPIAKHNMCYGACLLWRALARTASVQCITLLRHMCAHIDTTDFAHLDATLRDYLLAEVSRGIHDDRAPSAASRAMALFKHLGGNILWNCDNALVRYYSIDVDGRSFCSGDGNYWIDDALQSCDGLSVVAAHGTQSEHTTAFVRSCLKRNALAQAGLALEAFHNVYGKHLVLDPLINAIPDCDTVSASIGCARWLFAHGIVPDLAALGRMFRVAVNLWDKLPNDEHDRRIMGCVEAVSTVWPCALVSGSVCVLPVLKNLVVHGRWEAMDRVLASLSRALQHVIQHTLEDQTIDGARHCCCCDLPLGAHLDGETLWPVGDPRWNAHGTQYRPLWNDIAKHNARIEVVPAESHKQVAEGHVVLFRHASALAFLADRCDPNCNPDTADA